MIPRNLRARLLPGLLNTIARVPTPALLSIRPVLAACLRASPLRRRLRESMSAALGRDGFTSRHVEAYFRHMADQVAFGMAVYRSGFQASGLSSRWQLESSSIDTFRRGLEAGRGALLVGPHLMCHEMVSAMGATDLPIAMVARQSSDPRYQAVKERWYTGLGAELVLAPGKQAARMVTILRVLRKNRVLGITPDLIQKRGKGVPVRFFDRPVNLAPGAFFLAVRTRAAFIPCYTRYEDGIYKAWAEPALVPQTDLDTDSAVADLAQRWVTQFEGFLRRHPDMWQFWLDKRWSGWLLESS